MATNIIPNQRSFRYSPTYAGLPINEIAGSLAMGADDWEKNQDKYTAIKIFESQVQTLPQDQQYVRDTFQRANESIAQFSKKGAERFDLANRATDQLTREVYADPRINAAIQSFANFQQGEQLKQQMRAEGKTPLEFSDPTKHQSVDANGTVQIYRPVIEAKGDYLREAAGLWNTIAPELISANLTPSEVEGILQGKTVKGITPEMINAKLNLVEQAYRNTDSGMQQRRLLSHNGQKDPDTFIREFLSGVGMLKTHLDTDIKYQADPEWKTREWYKQAQYRADLQLRNKQLTGRGNHNENADKWFSPIRTNATRGAVGKDRAIMIGINNQEIINGISSTLPVPQRDTYEFVGTDTKNLNSGKNDGNIVIEGTPKVIGLVSTDVYGDSYRGGYYANVTFRRGAKGKPEQGTIIIKNGNDNMRNRVKTIADIEKVVEKPRQEDSKKGYFVSDTGGILNFATQKLNEVAQEGGFSSFNGTIGFMVRPTGNGKDGLVTPSIQTSPGHSQALNAQQLRDLGLKSEYTVDDIYKMTQDLLVNDFEPYVQTKKTLQEQAGSTSNGSDE